MGKEEEDRVYQGLPANPSDSRIWGAGTAGNVAGAIGGFFSGGEGGTPSPYGARGGGRNLMAASGGSSSSGGGTSTRPAAAPAASSSRSSWNPLTSTSAGASGMMQAAASPGSIIQRSIQSSLNRTYQRTGQTGMATPTSRTGTLQTGAQRMQAAQTARAAQPISADRQRRVDIQASHQTSVQKAADPLNWAGIAKDLGNAGDARYAKYKTGQPASTNAKRIVGTQQAAARAEVNRGKATQSASRATKAAKSKKGGGKNANKAV